MDELKRHPIATVPVFAFVLQPEFPLNGLVLASEALRIANQNSGRELFRWHFVSESGDPVRASNGMWFPADADIDSMPSSDFCLVFEGNLPTQRISARFLNRLRAAHRGGAAVGGVDTGLFALAQAGLAGEQDVVLHWEAAAAYRERYAGATIHDQLFLIDGNLIHCAGGVATLDLMLELIGRLHSPSLASEVANALVHAPRPHRARQRMDDPAADIAALPRRIFNLMENHLDFPLSLDAMAQQLGVSSRTLTRECQRRFAEPPMRLYLRIRLQAARNLLFYEETSIKDVALACGFSYPAVFTRAFKAQFGETPRAYRSALRQRQDARFRPEIRRLARARPVVA